MNQVRAGFPFAPTATQRLEVKSNCSKEVMERMKRSLTVSKQRDAYEMSPKKSLAGVKQLGLFPKKKLRSAAATTGVTAESSPLGPYVFVQILRLSFTA